MRPAPSAMLPAAGGAATRALWPRAREKRKKAGKNLKKGLQWGGICGKIIRHDCDRYALKREVAARLRPVFPWSMSDFKPGEHFLDVWGTGYPLTDGKCVIQARFLHCPDVFTDGTRRRLSEGKLIRFFHAGARNTRHGVPGKQP